jgi:hypothetical protein
VVSDDNTYANAQNNSDTGGIVDTDSDRSLTDGNDSQVVNSSALSDDIDTDSDSQAAATRDYNDDINSIGDDGMQRNGGIDPALAAGALGAAALGAGRLAGSTVTGTQAIAGCCCRCNSNRR